MDLTFQRRLLKMLKELIKKPITEEERQKRIEKNREC